MRAPTAVASVTLPERCYSTRTRLLPPPSSSSELIATSLSPTSNGRSVPFDGSRNSGTAHPNFQPQQPDRSLQNDAVPFEVADEGYHLLPGRDWIRCGLSGGKGCYSVRYVLVPLLMSLRKLIWFPPYRYLEDTVPSSNFSFKVRFLPFPFEVAAIY